MTEWHFKKLFKIWLFTSLKGANEYNKTEIYLLKKRGKLQQKP